MFSIVNSIVIAKRITARAAKTKDWRLSRTIDREMKSLAQSMDKGYILATPNELNEKFPALFEKDNGPDQERKIIWAIDASIPNRYGRVRLSFCPIR